MVNAQAGCTHNSRHYSILGTSSSGWLDFLLLDCCRALVWLRLCLWKVLRPPSHCLSLVLCFFCLSLSLILAGCWLGAVQMPNAQCITIRRSRSHSVNIQTSIDRYSNAWPPSVSSGCRTCAPALFPLSLACTRCTTFLVLESEERNDEKRCE